MRIKHLILFLLLFTGIQYFGFSQEVRVDSNGVFEGKVDHIDHEDLALLHSPKKATILSVCIPGAGQIYNKKWWKASIVWGGIGTSLYLSQQYRNDYHFLKDQYIRRIDSKLEDDYPNIPTASLEYQMNNYRKRMEISYIAAGVIYVLQILDANVDAHLMSFDVSNELSLKIEPRVNYNHQLSNPEYSISLRLACK